MKQWAVKELKSRISNFRGLTVLDLGCGSGQDSIQLAKLGAIVTAVDKDATTITIAEREARNKKLKILFTVSDLLNFEPNTTYDLILFNYVLHLIPKNRQIEATQKVLKVIAQGGTLLFSDLEDKQPVSSKCLQILKGGLTISRQFISKLTINHTPKQTTHIRIKSSR